MKYTFEGQCVSAKPLNETSGNEEDGKCAMLCELQLHELLVAMQRGRQRKGPRGHTCCLLSLYFT